MKTFNKFKKIHLKNQQQATGNFPPSKKTTT